MTTKTIEFDASKTIVVAVVEGDLSLKGWKRPDLLVETPADDDIEPEQTDETVTLRCPGDCILHVPHDADLHIERVDKDARLASLTGAVKLDQVGASLKLRDVGETTVSQVGANLSAKRVRGDLHVHSVGANASIGDVDGQVGVETVGGNLRLSAVSGGVTAKVGGNAKLDIAPVPWQVYEIQAGGNLRCTLPDEFNASLTLKSGAQSIRVKCAQKSETIRGGEHHLDFGAGDASINLRAGGKIDLICLGDVDWDSDDEFEINFNGEDFAAMAGELAQQATEQVEVHMKALNERLADLPKSFDDIGLTEERLAEIEEKIAKAQAQASQRAQEVSEQVQQRLEQRLKQVQKKAERAAERAERKRQGRKKSTLDVDALIASARGESEPVSDEERMLILKMLEDGNISVEQAEQLLAALEGKSE